MELPEAREVAQNLLFWRMLPKNSATHLYRCTLILDWTSMLVAMRSVTCNGMTSCNVV